MSSGSSDQRQEWRCPGCSKRWSIPASAALPTICPECQSIIDSQPATPTFLERLRGQLPGKVLGSFIKSSIKVTVGVAVVMAVVIPLARHYANRQDLERSLERSRELNEQISDAQERRFQERLDAIMAPRTPAEPVFGYENLSLRINGGYAELIGEICNKSTTDFKLANYKATVYDEYGKMLDLAFVSISNLGSGDTKSFSAVFLNADVNRVDTAQVKFENGL